MKKMTSRERVLSALRLEEPDRVPWVDEMVSYDVSDAILAMLGCDPIDRSIKKEFPETPVPIEIARALALDNIVFEFEPPMSIFAITKPSETESDHFVDGKIRDFSDLKLFDQMPDPDDEIMYRRAEAYIRRYKDDFAMMAHSRTGAIHTILSFGMMYFFEALVEKPDLVQAVFDRFSDWFRKSIKNIHELDIDIMQVSDDIAFKSGPLFSPDMLRSIFLPGMHRVAETIKVPWLFHSDGKLDLILEDLLSLGMNGIANIEPPCMDIAKLKIEYGDRICLVGNIDLSRTLSMGTVEDTLTEVKNRIREIGPGGGYIMASSNSITPYCKPENVLCMSNTLIEHGHYPINIDEYQ